MALFFDKDWFDAALARSHMARGDLARALGLSDEEIAEVWKDQRELSAREVATMAALLAVTPDEIAHHAGVSTPVPKNAAPAEQAPASGEALERLEARLTRVEILLEEMKALLEQKVQF